MIRFTSDVLFLALVTPQFWGTLILSLTAAVVVGATVWILYNRLIRSRQRMLEAWSGIDVQLKRRASLIPNLVESVRGYATHEHGVFEDVARARSMLDKASGAQDSSSANTALSQALGRLFAVVERYPALQAAGNFLDLQRDLTDTEEKIAFARHFYNQNVLDYNTRIQTFPSAFFAREMGFQAASFFEAEPQARADVKVVFGASQP